MLGRSRPKKWIGPISAQILLYTSGPDPAQKTGLGQDQPGPATNAGGGIIRSACRNEKKENTVMKGGGRITWHGGGGGACCVTGGVVALRWKPVVVSSGAIVPTAAPSSAATSPSSDVLPGSLLFFRFLCSLAVSSSPSSQCWVFGVSLLCFG